MKNEQTYLRETESFLTANEAAVRYGNSATSLEKIAIIREGLPLNALEYFMARSGLSKIELANILQVSARTLQRYKPGDTLTPNITEKLLALNSLYQLGTRALGGNAQEFTQWLKQPCRALGNRLPLSLLDTYTGTQEVERTLGRLEWGVYA